VRLRIVSGILAAILCFAGDLAAQETQEEAAAAPESTAAAPPKRSALPSRRSSMINANEAKRRLAQAELKRSAGIEPLPGEYARGPDGITVNNRYWQRQEKLRIEVDQALRRVNYTERRQQAASR
jgi:hypothetical protein